MGKKGDRSPMVAEKNVFHLKTCKSIEVLRSFQNDKSRHIKNGDQQKT